MEIMTSIHSDLLAIKQHLLNKAENTRILVAIAGPPGVGKSTFASTLKQQLNNQLSGCCAILPMDGFHYDDTYLDQKNWRSRKGAPHTFDVGGLRHMLARLTTNEEDNIAIPVFDRDIEISRAAADEISSSVRIILVEGNYLLLDKQPWSGLAKYFDISIMLRASIEVIEKRLRQRWTGFDYTLEQIAEKMNANDVPNVKTVLDLSIKADFEIPTD